VAVPRRGYLCQREVSNIGWKELGAFSLIRSAAVTSGGNVMSNTCAPILRWTQLSADT